MTWFIVEGAVVPAGNGYGITDLGGTAAVRRLDRFESMVRKRIRGTRYRGTNKVEFIDEIEGKTALVPLGECPPTEWLLLRAQCRKSSSRLLSWRCVEGMSSASGRRSTEFKDLLSTRLDDEFAHDMAH